MDGTNSFTPACLEAVASAIERSAKEGAVYHKLERTTRTRKVMQLPKKDKTTSIPTSWLAYVSSLETSAVMILAPKEKKKVIFTEKQAIIVLPCAT